MCLILGFTLIVLSLYYNQIYLLTGPGRNHAAFDYLVFAHFSETINNLMSLLTIFFLIKYPLSSNPVIIFGELIMCQASF